MHIITQNLLTNSGLIDSQNVLVKLLPPHAYREAVTVLLWNTFIDLEPRISQTVYVMKDKTIDIYSLLIVGSRYS